MRGNTDKGVKYTKFGVRVVGNKAKEVFTQHLQAMQQKDKLYIQKVVVVVMALNTTFSNISAISWRSVILSMCNYYPFFFPWNFTHVSKNRRGT
jgi:hypothetical protein